MTSEDGAGPPTPEHTHVTAPAPPAATTGSSDSEWSEPTIVSHQPGDPTPLPFENAAPAQHRTEREPAYVHEPVPPLEALPPDLIPYRPERARPVEPKPVPEPEPLPSVEPASAQPAEPDPARDPRRAPRPPRTAPPPAPPMQALRARVAYERGSVGDDHAKLVERAADVAVAALPVMLRVLDVGCGDGRLLAELILRVPYADLYVGVDPIPDVMPDVQLESDPRLCLVRAAAESLPFPDASFDLVMATMSFGYWKDQRKGLAELARVVARRGKVVLVEPTGGDAKDKGRLHSEKDITYALGRAGLELQGTETVSRSRMGKAQAKAFVASP